MFRKQTKAAERKCILPQKACVKLFVDNVVDFLCSSNIASDCIAKLFVLRYSDMLHCTPCSIDFHQHTFYVTFLGRVLTIDGVWIGYLIY
jgi:hypothetical protein